MLAREIDSWSRRPLTELESTLKEPTSYACSSEGTTFQVEVQLLEVEPSYIHVAVAVDDGSLWRSLKPLSSSFIVHRDGRVEK